MPINYLEIKQQVQKMGADAARFQMDEKKLLIELRLLLQEYENQHDVIERQIALSESAMPMLRCAAPGLSNESLLSIHPAPKTSASANPFIILASDGSQINPSRHDAVEMGLINLGLIRMITGSGGAPSVFTRSRLLYPGMSDLSLGYLSEELVALLRDVEERKFLAEMAMAAQRELSKTNEGELLPIIAFTDGPLELFREPRGDEEQRQRFQQYLTALDLMADIDGIPAGYVDKPRANLLVNLLELMTLTPDAIEHTKGLSKYSGIDDTTLLSPWLLPGCRTTVFRLVSRSAKNFTQMSARLSLYFFYINVGQVYLNGKRRDLYARVEIPAWVANNAVQMERLHWTILDQCEIMGANPYPYVLHRAHEIAVVHFAEKEELMRMIVAELISNGIPVKEESMKSENKAASGSRKERSR